MSSTVNTGNNVFAVPIFFIALREALEASLIIGILLASVESLVKEVDAGDLLSSHASTSTAVNGDGSDVDKEGRSGCSTPQATAAQQPRMSADDIDATVEVSEKVSDIQMDTAGAEVSASSTVHQEQPTGDAPTPSSQQQRAARIEQLKSERRRMIKKLRKTVLLGALCGLLIAFAIGAAFLAVFYTQTSDLYGKAEELWEGIFNLIAVCLIVPMSLAILRFSSGGVKHKWTRKLRRAFEKSERLDRQGRRARATEVQIPASDVFSNSDKGGKSTDAAAAGGLPDAVVMPELELGGSQVSCSSSTSPASAAPLDRQSSWLGRLRALRSKPSWILFSIPLVTTLREGLEGVVFIGGVSLGLPGSSIPLPAILGLAIGFGIGLAIWRGGKFVGHVRYFLLASTCALLIIAAGMASRSIFYLQFYSYVMEVGDAAAESGSGPGSYNPRQAIAHFNYGNPENNKGGSGYGLLNSLFGWENTWTYGSTLSYIAFWLAIAAYLLCTMWKEGRLAIAWSWKGREHRVWESKRRRLRREKRESKREERALAAKSNPISA